MRTLVLLFIALATRLNIVTSFSSSRTPPHQVLANTVQSKNDVARRRTLSLKMMEEKDVNDITATSRVNVTDGSFRMVYTCNKCETRNMVKIKRKVWEEGVVIATCQGCGVKHLLADNQGLINIGDAYNAVDNAKKDSVVNKLKLDASMDDNMKNDLLSEFDLTTDEKGNIQLLPRPGDENIVKKDRVSATGPAVDASLVTPEIKRPELASITDEGGDGSSSSSARMDSYGDGGSFDIDIPPGIESGDLLQLDMGGQIMMLPVPDGATSSVKVLGAIEFAIPKNKKEGDIVILKTPDGDTLSIKIPSGVTEGSFLKVAYPVVLNP